MEQVMIWEGDPDEWSYVAEGGKHAIFRYRGADNGLSGHLLRIAKSKLARISAAFDGSGGGGWESTSSTRRATTLMTPVPAATSARANTTIAFIDNTTSQEFQRQIIQPLLCHRYLDLARAIYLSAHFCAQLYRRTLTSGLIPPSRLPSWKFDVIKQDTTPTVDDNEGVNALLLRDHTHISRHHLLSTTSNNTPPSSIVLSVEIKPKAGYISTSPLVLPTHRCKYYRTRYSLQQELMQLGQIHKGWRRSRSRTRVDEACEQEQQSTEGINVMQDETAFIPSNYSPLDLFSGNSIRIQMALVDLSCNMQNNFRVWCNGNQIFGDGKPPPTDSGHSILQDMFPSFGDDSENYALDRRNMDWKATLLDVIVTTVTKILERESSLLSNMLSVQQLDWIDGDGAVIIYERLVHLCNGSNSEAEMLLDAAVLIPGNAFCSKCKEDATIDLNDWRSKHITSSPYTAPKCNALQQLLEEIHHFQSYLCEQQQHCDSSFDEVCDNSHFNCIEFVNKLSKDACIYLLQNWLLSSSVCDVSFFVTFRFLKEYCTVDGALIDERQTCYHGGIVHCSMQNNNGELSTRRDIAVEYEVKVIDCDPKPAKKLRDRREVEDACQFVSKKRIDDVDEQVG